VTWRLLLTIAYAAAVGAVLALENSDPGMSEVPILAAWLVAVVVGFLVGRPWVMLAAVGAVVGRTIGWDAGENDGNPALWPPYVVVTIIAYSLPLFIGVGVRGLWHNRRDRPAESG
jgi:hypothetical protein